MTDDDFVDFLAKQGRSGVAAFHQFRLSYSDEGEQIHVFLEGDDDALFYLPHVRGRLKGKNLFTYFCGGKWGVVEARDLVRADGPIDECLFFVDRDFDDYFQKQPTPHEQMYLTDTYSIENALVCDEALEVVLLDFARMSKADPAHSRIVEAWSLEREEFVSAIKPIMAWALAMRDAGRKPNFNNADLRKVFRKRDGKWRREAGGFTEFKKATCRQHEEVSFGEVRAWLNKLPPGQEKCWVRGKYELWFFETFLLSRLTVDGAKSMRWNVPTALRQRRLFDVLGARVSPPASLVAFLDARLARAQ